MSGPVPRSDCAGVPVALCVLAAGASRRLGEPKALAEIGGQAALGHLVRALAEALPGRTPVVVTGAHDAEIRREIQRWATDANLSLDVIHNRRWSEGRTGSVALGAAARPGHDLLIAPVDVPLVRAGTLRALVREWERRGSPARGWLAPRVAEPASPGAGRFGHPVVAGRELVSGLTRLVRDEPLSALRASARPLWGLDVTDDAVLDDLDTPADLAGLRAAWTVRARHGN